MLVPLFIAVPEPAAGTSALQDTSLFLPNCFLGSSAVGTRRSRPAARKPPVPIGDKKIAAPWSLQSEERKGEGRRLEHGIVVPPRLPAGFFTLVPGEVFL